MNRALVVERELAMAKDLEIVNVLPTLHAGGSGQLAAFDYMKDPVEVEEIVPNNNNCLRRFLLRSQEKPNPIKKGPTL